jgi:hypothetical protein
MKKNFKSAQGKMLLNEAPKWTPGLVLRNANGDISDTGLGYDYAIRTTTWLRTKSIQQKFYEIAPADFVTIEVGTGAWMEQITTNLEYNAAGDFEDGIVNIAAGKSEIPTVDVGIAPKTYPVVTWNKGYMYSVPEIEKALASNNWDVVKAKSDALKKNWDLGIQRTAFLGSKSGMTDVEGLLTLSEVTSDTDTLKKKIADLSVDEFATFVQTIMGLFFANSNSTQSAPDTFIMPMDDYLGLTGPQSPAFPMNSRLEWLQRAFAQATGNKNFKISGVVYAMAANHPSSVNRYMLYRNDPEVVLMSIPVNFNLLSPNTGDNYQWKGVAYGQYTGVQNFRPREAYYLDWA